MTSPARPESKQIAPSSSFAFVAAWAVTASMLLAASGCDQAVENKPANKPTSTSLTLPSGLPAAPNDWGRLTASQQAALQPLAADWATLSDGQRRKWISISANFQQMTPEQQATLHERMVQWTQLSAQERAVARLNYAQTKGVHPQKKTEQWQAYQALSDEEKRQLATSAPPKPPRTALATKPTPTDQINHQLRLHSKSAASAPSSVTETHATRQQVTDITDEPSKP